MTRGPARPVRDPLQRELHISLGCALENMELAAPAAGLAATVTLLPDPAAPGHVARVDLRPGTDPVSPLFAAIPNRHTDRAAYNTSRQVDASRLDGLTALVTAPVAGLVWFTDPARMRTFGNLTLRATEAINADPRQSADDSSRTTASGRSEMPRIPPARPVPFR